METMLMRVVVRNYFPNGRYENNTIEFLIPKEAGEIIKKAWHSEELNQSDPNVIHAKYLCTNQTASVGLYKHEKDLDGVAGIFACNEFEIRKNSATEFVEATSKNSLSGKYETRWVVTKERPYYDDDVEYFNTKEDALEYLEEEFEHYKKICNYLSVDKSDYQFTIKTSRGYINCWVEEV